MTVAVSAQAESLAASLARSVRAVDPGGGPDWLKTLRKTAVSEFLSNGLPGNKDEAWKYTSLRPLENLHPELGTIALGEATGGQAPPLSVAGGFGFRVFGGRLHWLQQEMPQGVSMLALSDLLSQDSPQQLRLLRPLLEAVRLKGRGHAFEALNTVLLRDGVLIRVSAGVDAGLCQLQWSLGGSASPRLDNFRIIIILEDGARLRLLEQFQCPAALQAGPATVKPLSSGHALNQVLQLQLAAGSELQHVRLQNEAPESVLFTFTEVSQAERSSYQYCGFDIGGGLVRHGINCRLTGPGARAEINGAFVLDHQRHVDHHICIDHLAPACSSEQFFRGVLGGHSRGVFNGKAVIRAGADGSRVRQSNANLLLSDQAEIDTKPELEIYADEVEASHGATVGQLDEQAVFYLRSRGLAETAARRMLTSAFCRMVTARLPDADMAEQIAALLEAAMPVPLSKAEETD